MASSSLTIDEIRKDPALSRWVHEDEAGARFRVSRDAFVDPEVFAQERDRIFDRCWLYVGHASELRNPNDYITRSVGGREVIFNRDRKGQFHVFFNSCPHRGAIVAREKHGNAISFRCFYHGWAFSNAGKFASRFDTETYPSDFNANGCADLTEVSRVEQYGGFYFMHIQPDAVSLEEYLGETKAIIDLVNDQSEAGMEVIGGDQRYSIRSNWKLLVENSYDGFHAAETHSTYFDYLRDATDGEVVLLSARERMSRGIDFGRGHGMITSLAPWGRPVAHWIPAWGEAIRPAVESVRARLEARFGAERATLIARRSRNLVIFPNLVINDIMAITVRTFYPDGPEAVNVDAWALAPSDETPELRRLRLDNFLEFLGPGGFATPDDQEALESAQRGYRNRDMAGWNDLSRGMRREEPLADDEAQMRGFWREWARMMAAEETGAEKTNAKGDEA